MLIQYNNSVAEYTYDAVNLFQRAHGKGDGLKEDTPLPPCR